MKILLIITMCAFTLSFNRAVAQNQAVAGGTPLRIIAFGAHPDDAELKASGMAAIWASQGHKVKFVAMTNGDVGHFEESGGALAKRRGGQASPALPSRSGRVRRLSTIM